MYTYTKTPPPFPLHPPSHLSVPAGPVVASPSPVFGHVDVLLVVELGVGGVEDAVDHAGLQVQQHRPGDVVLVIGLGREGRGREGGEERAGGESRRGGGGKGRGKEWREGKEGRGEQEGRGGKEGRRGGESRRGGGGEREGRRGGEGRGEKEGRGRAGEKDGRWESKASPK